MPKESKKKKAAQIQRVKGMHDILPDDQWLWDQVRSATKKIAEYYNFVRLDTPVLEQASLFERTVGEATDIVEKQMFIVQTKGKEKLVMRPEWTAGAARAYIENSLNQRGFPVKLYTDLSLFRYEQPQEGRFREFHQLDLEIISSENDPIYDVQIMLVLTRIIESLKIKGFSISVNSIGCKSCRPPYKKELQNYYKGVKSQLCADCIRRLDVNPLRLLDCKEEKCVELKKNAPIIIDHLCNTCHNHFKQVLEYLDEVQLPYALDHHLVRGLDYYTKTVFEINCEGVDFALAGGGRYDYLIELLGGKSTPAVGAAAGMERLIKVMKMQNPEKKPKEKQKIFLVHIGELAKKKSLSLIEELRKSNIEVTESLGKESLKAQLRVADKEGCSYALIFGQREAFEDNIILRDLKTGTQETVMLRKLAETLKKRS